MRSNREPNYILRGFLLLIAIHFWIAPIVLFLLIGSLHVISVSAGVSDFFDQFLNPLAENWIFFYLAMGSTQLIHVIPLVIFLYRRGNYGLMKGVIIAATVIAFLNGGCFLTILYFL